MLCCSSNCWDSSSSGTIKLIVAKIIFNPLTLLFLKKNYSRFPLWNYILLVESHYRHCWKPLCDLYPAKRCAIIYFFVFFRFPVSTLPFIVLSKFLLGLECGLWSDMFTIRTSLEKTVLWFGMHITGRNLYSKHVKWVLFILNIDTA